MGSSKIQGELWGKAPQDWTKVQEPMHTPLFEAMLNVMNVGQGTHLLDAGCGGGGASVLAAERRAQVSGLDAAEPLLNIARESVPYGDFRVGDIEELPHEDDSFDAIIAANSLQYAADRVATLRELRRVCASGGRVSVGLWSTPDTVEYRVVFKAVRDALPEPPPGKGPFELSEPGILEGLIEQVGLKVLDTGEAACPFNIPKF
jgi:SAM-dependent methyltransferase